jgi:anion-transporting  ArsA/GET3 family ATPase
MSSMYEGFRERAHQTRALLEADTTSFVLVTAPMPERLDEAVFFHTTLLQNHLTIASVVVNRVHPPVPSALWAEAKRLPDELRKRVEATLNENDHLAAQDARGIARLAELCGPTPLTLVPRFELDVHDLSSLWNTSRFLFGEARLEPAQPAR